MQKAIAYLKARLASFPAISWSPTFDLLKSLRSRSLPWFTRGDLDGFFGLFIDNLLQLMLIGILGGMACKLPSEFITRQILPGAALSILFGNLFYAFQARRLALKTGRNDV